MGDIGGHLSAKGAFIDTNNDGVVDGFAHTIKNAGNFNTFSLTNGVLTVQGPTGGAAIGGSSTHVQYNQGGVFKGESTFTYNESTNTLNIANVVISGDLTVSGTTTTINTATLDVADNIITLNSDLGGGVAPSQNAGILINRGSSDDAQFIWDEGNDQWNFSDVGGTEHDLAGVAKVFAKGAGAVYTFTTDTDTGIEHTGTDQLGLVTGNTRVLMVSTNGVHIAPGGATGAGSNEALRVDDVIIDTQTITTFDANKNLILAPHGSGSVELGAVSSNATSVITTPSAHNVVGTSVSIQAGSTTAATTDNIAGGSLTLSAGQGKGTGAGGSILFKTADGGSSGSTLNPLTTKMTILDSGFVGIAQNTPTVPLHVGGDAIISGNLTVSGTSTTVSTTNTFVTDDILTLNSGESANGVASGAAGIEIDRGANGGVDNTIARFIYDESDDKFKTQMETGSGSGSYNPAGFVASSVEGTTGTFSGDLTVDTNVLKVDTANNRVGVNKAPTVAFDVTGNVQGDSDATFSGTVSGEMILAHHGGFAQKFRNNNASATVIGMPLRIDGSHATNNIQANQAQSNSLINCAVGLSPVAVAAGAIGNMIVSGQLNSVPASSFVGSDPADGKAIYLSGTVGKLTVDIPSTGYVQQVGSIVDTTVSVSGNSGTADIIVQIGTPILAEVYDGDAQGVTTVTGTLPSVSTGGATPAISINAATTGAAGSMSAADKTKLDGIATSATATDPPAIVDNSGTPAFASGITKAEVLSILNVEDGADVTDATNVNAAGAVMESDVNAKGDIFVATANNTLTRLAVGTNNHVLTADSAQASGVKWAAASGGGATAGYLTSLSGTNVNVTGYAGVFNAIAGGFTAPLLVPLAADTSPSTLNQVISGSIIMMASPLAAGGVINLDHTAMWASAPGIGAIDEAFHLVFVNTDGGTYVIESTGALGLTINGATAYTNNTQYSATSVVIIAGAPQQGFAWG